MEVPEATQARAEPEPVAAGHEEIPPVERPRFVAPLAEEAEPQVEKETLTAAIEPEALPPHSYEKPRAENRADADTSVSQFEAAPPFRRRRNPLRMWTWAAGIFAVLAAGTIVTVSRWGLPDWVPVNQPTFGYNRADLQLDFPPDQQERRQLPNGTEYFGASGTITNVGGSSKDVPPILIVLRDSRERIVYQWEVQPPKRTLAPGESVRVNEAVTDVPRSARVAEIGWKPA